MNHRVIARLDIKGPNLVKGIHLEGLRVLGKPEDFSRYYYEQGADELVYMDVVASLYERNSLNEIISRTASETFIPLTVGGGLRSIADMRAALRAGADKVAINTAAIRSPELIRSASRYFGSSTIVVSIEAIRQLDGRYLAYVDNGREHTGVEVVSWARQAEELGAGEVFLTSVDREGTGDGFDIELVRHITEAVSLPVIASGGAGSAGHVVELFGACDVSAVAVASVVHYDFVKTHALAGDFSREGNVEFRRNPSDSSRIEPTGIRDIKDAMAVAGIDCRR